MNAIQLKIENLLNAPINLENYCDLKNLNPPSYEYQKDEHEHRKFYQCSIEIDGQCYHGQDISKRLAKCRAALNAINNLKIEDDNNNDIPPSYDEQIDSNDNKTTTANDQDNEDDDQEDEEDEEEESEQDSDEIDNA